MKVGTQAFPTIVIIPNDRPLINRLLHIGNNEVKQQLIANGKY